MHQHDRPTAGDLQQSVPDHIRHYFALVVAHLDTNSMDAWCGRMDHRAHFGAAANRNFSNHRVVDVESRSRAKLRGHPQARRKLHALPRARQHVTLHPAKEASKTWVSAPALHRCPERTRCRIEDGLQILAGEQAFVDFACDRRSDSPDSLAQVLRCLVVRHRGQYRTLSRLRR